LLAATVGCPSSETVGANAVAVLGAGVVNNPKNKSLRFDVLEFGLERFCEQMTQLSVPLKLSDDQPVIGRFYADTCSSQVLDTEQRKSLVVQYAGKGYAWTNVTKRVAFRAAGLIEYAPDFQMHDGAMYVYFRPRRIDANSFETLLVESWVAKTGMALTRTNPDEVGLEVVKSQLQRGFTVVRYDSAGETDFGLGYIPMGQKPFKPFQIQGSEKQTLVNDRTEVHTGQQDFIGGFAVTEADQALYFTLSLDGAPTVDAIVVRQGNASLMIKSFLQTAGPTPLTAPPLLGEAVTAGQLWKRYLPVPKGLYYLVIDHSSAVGNTAPPSQAGDDRAAKLDYLVQVGEVP
jgi:hypothetical protein